MEKFAYVLLAIAVLCWLAAILFGLIAAFPFGLIGLIGITGIGILFIKVLNERMRNKEDDYYAKHIDK